MKIFRNKILTIILGLLLILVSVGGFWWDYTWRNNPLDQIPESIEDSGSPVAEPTMDENGGGSLSVEQLDENQDFLPLIETQPEELLPGTEPADEVEQVFIPDRIIIPAINLDAPIVPVGFKEVEVNLKNYKQWIVPNEYAAGWHELSATLGVPGNTVLNGHHNVYGKVFGDIIMLQVGDLIQVYSGEAVFLYQVEIKMLLPERYQSLKTRMENARWLSTSEDERLTLVTCWPAADNTHRVVIVAFPILDPDSTP